eukprot:332186-Chlamydomonas_euryale.AAC.1
MHLESTGTLKGCTCGRVNVGWEADATCVWCRVYRSYVETSYTLGVDDDEQEFGSALQWTAACLPVATIAAMLSHVACVQDDVQEQVKNPGAVRGYAAPTLLQLVRGARAAHAQRNMRMRQEDCVFLVTFVNRVLAVQGSQLLGTAFGTKSAEELPNVARSEWLPGKAAEIFGR